MFELPNKGGQILKRLDAELRSILHRHLWLGCRDRDQKADTIPILDLVRKRESRRRDEPNGE